MMLNMYEQKDYLNATVLFHHHYHIYIVNFVFQSLAKDFDDNLVSWNKLKCNQ